MKIYRMLGVASAALFIGFGAHAQNVGNVTNHALPIGKGAGVQGFGSLLLGNAQIAVGQTSADPLPKTVGGDVTMDNTGAFAIGASKVTNTMLVGPVPVNKGGTAATTAAGARGSSGLGMEAFTGHGDSIYTILSTDQIVGTNAAFTASRTWTLPAANAVNPGQCVKVYDFQGTVTGTNTIVIARAGADTVNSGTSVTINTANGGYHVCSDGISKWSAQAVGSTAIAGVSTVFGRSGAVTAATADYTAAQIGANGVVYQVKVQSFSASGTYTPSTGILYAISECWGAGGGGGGSAGAASDMVSAGGGGAGSKSIKYSSAAAIGASKTVTIGTGGAGGTGNATGSAGGDSSVGTLCVGKGGSGGLQGNALSVIPGGGAGGVAGTGDITGVGMSGGAGALGPSTTFLPSGMGGSTEFGSGGASAISGSSSFASGAAASGLGAGGSGASTNNSGSTPTGGAGANGFVRITEFLNQ